MSKAGERLTRATAILAGRLARLLTGVEATPEAGPSQTHAFLWSCYEAECQGVAPETWAGQVLERDPDERPQPIDLLVERFKLSPLELEMLLLAAMAEEHEGYSVVLRSLHPRSEPRATAGIAAQLLFPEEGGHRQCRELIELGTLFRAGLVRLSGDAPLFDRSLVLAEQLWPALHGLDVWPSEIVPLPLTDCRAGLRRWLTSPAAQRAIRAVRSGGCCTVVVNGDDAAAASHRAAALVLEADAEPQAVSAAPAQDAHWRRLLEIHTALRGSIPVLCIAHSDTPPPAPAEQGFTYGDAPLVVAGAGMSSAFSRGRALISVDMEPLSFLDRRCMWAGMIPRLGDSASLLASRYPLEPHRVAEVALDLAMIESVEGRTGTVSDVSCVLRSRSHRSLSAGVRLVHPKAAWDDLVLPRDLIDQLHEAVDRLLLQSRVLDDWGFERNRTGARGVRLLFAGPPGTGKTLSAEVLAGALNADLLVVDVSRVVSKWIGETEKNLAAVFDAAESSQAVLLFDEADALFAKRTDVSDAHDRYANLETAYLLQRLERYEGLAILATNLRQNIDAAFVRRLEFVLGFSDPDREQRMQLWKRHIPKDVPMDGEVNFYELAALYPVVGGVVRNAAVAAGFRAAADGMPLCRLHLIHALKREYEKAGKAFPGLPAGMRI